ncbi:MAG: hypothetical protein Kow0099_26950 [Candidatus Abyssubacteria bacterium]
MPALLRGNMLHSNHNHMTASPITSPEHTIDQWVRRLAARMNGATSPAVASVRRLSPSHRPALYQFDNGALFVVKEYWRDPECDPALALLRARRETKRFALCRQVDLCGKPDRTASLLASRSRPPAALAVEYVEGSNLGRLIRHALKENSNPSSPFLAAAAVARCLAHIHSVSNPPIAASPSSNKTYPDKIIAALNGIMNEELQQAAGLLRSARNKLSLSNNRLIHGDANPTNFIIEPSGAAVAIDLERLGRGDPHIDIGFLLADFIHMAQHNGKPHAAEELADAFRVSYKNHAPIDPPRELYFTALGLLRIARNPWHNPSHRAWLITQAQLLLDR